MASKVASGYFSGLDLFGKSQTKLVEGSFKSMDLGHLFNGNQVYDYFVGFYLICMSFVFYGIVEWNNVYLFNN